MNDIKILISWSAASGRQQMETFMSLTNDQEYCSLTELLMS